MGHYYSEMVSDEEQEREAADKKQRRDRLAANIKRKIDEDGLEYVLADMLRDPTLFKIWYG